MKREIEDLVKKYPLLNEIQQLKEVIWINQDILDSKTALGHLGLGIKDIMEASDRLDRFAPFIEIAFPETQEAKGIIESPLKKLDKIKDGLQKYYGIQALGNILLKCDNDLPISGSIKARGGIYEVLKHAEGLAIEAGILKKDDNYSILASDKFREFFSKYHIAVGSTGNLGLSIGIISAKLGFKVSVHMSADAKEWKKELLRSKGVEVVVYEDDYSKAVEEGRKLSELDPSSYFVDDENSVNLFMGYAVAALRLQKQMDEMAMLVDQEHPLFVYLPCGVGGGPGGVAFGLKHIFGDQVHFFFAEPTHSPCMLIGSMTKTHDQYCVQDFGIDNKTIADGLAVGRASGFVGKTLENLVSGCYTITDDKMIELLAILKDYENISLEPSALAGFGGILFSQSPEYQEYLKKNHIDENKITHIVWATGGSMVPADVALKDYEKGQFLLKNKF